MSEIMIANQNEIAYVNAMELHRQILTNETIAASAMLELCKNLKQMRDSGAYSHLGYDSFDTYVEEAANIKKRQAYNYISTYERLGPEVLQSNAQLGITKLQRLFHKDRHFKVLTLSNNLLYPFLLWDVPVFMKESLRDLMGAEFIQEFPAGLLTSIPEVII